MTVEVVNGQRSEFDVYIGRPSSWGNPLPLRHERERSAIIEKYRQWLWGEIKAGRVTVADLLELDGKTLGCWCKPKACHGDVIAAAVAWATQQ